MTKTDRIIEAARKRFYHYGISKTTMQEIASDAGLAVGTLYLYFANKDALVVACSADFVDRHHRIAAAILAAPAPAERKLRDYILQRFQAARDLRLSTPHAVELARAVMRVKPDRMLEEGQMMHQYVTSILAQGVDQDRLAIADPAADAMVFLFSVAWFFPNALAPPPFEPEEKDLLLVVDWFVRTWRAAAGKPARRKPARRRAVERSRLRGRADP